MVKTLLIFLAALVIPAALLSQQPYRMTAFHGGVYKLRVGADRDGFQNGIEGFDSIGHIVLSELQFPPGRPQDHFPSVNVDKHFAFLLKAKLAVNTTGCYRLTLASDDGSLLWIDDQLSINNDSLHEWRIKYDTLTLAAGVHQVDLWYYNAIGPSGLAFKVDTINSQYCHYPDPTNSVCLPFKHDDYQLTDSAKTLLHNFIGKLDAQRSYSIAIQGFADTSGTQTYNSELSAGRANSVQEYLERFWVTDRPDYRVHYYGEQYNSDKIQNRGCQSGRSVIIEATQR